MTWQLRRNSLPVRRVRPSLKFRVARGRVAKARGHGPPGAFRCGSPGSPARFVPVIERAGWRLLAAVAVFLGLLIIRSTPLTPLLRMSTHAPTAHTSIAGPAAWLYLPGLVLVAVAAFGVTRLT
jgi:hypothetical protein